MAKGKKVLVQPSQSFNPADFSTYDQVNAPRSDYSTGDVNTYDYQRDSSLDRGNISGYDLPSLNDTRAENQGAFSSIANSTGKFIGKTALNVVGGLAGTVYGAGSAIANGDIKKLWDNSFNTKVDAIDQSLDNIFKVYKSTDYENANFLQRAFLHPLQFIDDTSDALSFTAGAILTTLATEGLGDASILPKALKYMKSLGIGAEAAEATAELSSGTQAFLRGVGDAGKITKQLATGASYESIIEARKATMDLRNKMYADFAKENPNQPMDEATKAEIDDKLSKAGMFSYIANLALVGSSNMVQFPKIFGLGYNSSRIAAGAIERDVETGLYRAATQGKSLLRTIAGGLKNPAEEGLVEEGLQNVIAKTNNQYFDRKNDKSSQDDVSRFVTTVAHNIADVYSSKEGWNDIGMGMLIGGLGAPGRGALSVLGKENLLGKHGYDVVRDPETGAITGTKRAAIWTGGVFGGAEEQAHQAGQVAAVVNDLNKNTNLYQAMKNNYDFLVTSNSLEKDKDKAISQGDIFNFQNAKDDQIHAYTSSRIKAGLYEDLLDSASDMRKLSPDEFYTQFRGEEESAKLTQQEKTKFQQDSINEFLTKAENTKQAIKIADNVYKGDNDDLREELVHSIAASKNLDFRESQINQSIADLSNGFISNLKSATPEIEQEILQKFVENNPTEAALNKNKLIQLLDDSRKLRAKRQQYLDVYNHLFTEKGQNDFNKMQDDAKQAEETKQQEEQVAADKKEADKTKVDNNKVTVAKAKAATVTPEEDDEFNLEVATPEAAETTEAVANTEIPNVSMDDPETSDSLAIGDKVKTGNKTGIISAKNGNKVTIDFDGGGRLETDTNFVDIYKQPVPLEPEETAIVAVESHKEVQANRDVILHEDGLAKNAPESHYTQIGDIDVVNTDLQRTIGNSIAYLGVDKIKLGRSKDGEIQSRTFDIFNEDGSISINFHVDVNLFSQNQYKPNDQVGLRVPTFDQMLERGLDNYSETDYSNNKNSVEEFPIAITNSDNKIIGYLPTQSGINRLVAEEFRATALANNLAIRETIFANQGNTYKGSITSKSPGFVLADKFSNQKQLFDALGSGTKLADKVKLGVAKLGDIAINGSSQPMFTDGDIINKDKIQEGVIYSIVPSSQQSKYIAYPMRTNKIGLSNANTIVEAVRLFANLQANTLSKEDQATIDSIGDYNFSNFEDLNKFINSIMYASSKPNASDETTFKLFKDNLYLSKLAEDKYSLADIAVSKATRDSLASKLAQRYHSVSLANLNDYKPYFSYQLNSEDKLQEQDYNNYQDYLHKNSVITSNIRGIKIQDNEYAFTAQPVIGLSNTIQQETKQISSNKIDNKKLVRTQGLSGNRTLSEIEEETNTRYSEINLGNNLLAFKQENVEGTVTPYKIVDLNIKLPDGTSPSFTSNKNYKGELSKVNPSNVRDTAKSQDLNGVNLQNRLDEAVKRLSNIISQEVAAERTEEVPTSNLSDIAARMQQANDELGKLAESQQEQVKKSKLTSKKLFDPSKIKPKPLDDFNPEFIEQSTVKSAEDLMRKCL